MNELFFGTGIAHTILLFALVIATGIYLGRFKVKGVSIGSTWILFIGILLSHFGFRADPHILSFMKDFGLILFVFSIGPQDNDRSHVRCRHEYSGTRCRAADIV